MIKIFLLLIGFFSFPLTSIGQKKSCTVPEIWQNATQSCNRTYSDPLKPDINDRYCIYKNIKVLIGGRIDDKKLANFYKQYIKNKRSCSVVDRSIKKCWGPAQLLTELDKKIEQYEDCIKKEIEFQNIIKNEFCE